MSNAAPVMPQDVVIETIANNPYIPKLPTAKQLQFLELACGNALYGGAASGGKSEALLMAALQFVELVPNYAALIVRRKLKDLELSGGLIDRSLEWLASKKSKKGVKWNAQMHRWFFPNGSSLQFGYADNEGDEQRYHGAEFQFIGMDEACQFTEKQILFFMTERLRKKVEMPVPLRFRLATTPGGVGHNFIKKWFVDPGTPGDVFVPATVFDNPHVDQQGYVERLKLLEKSDPLRYKQMLEGDWDAVEGGRFKAEWFGRWRRERHIKDTVVLTNGKGDEIERFRPDEVQTFQTCDPAASTSKKADFFVLSSFKLTPRGNLVWWDCFRDKLEIDQQVYHCERLYREHQAQFVTIEKVLNQTALFQLLSKKAMVVYPVSPMGKDKSARAVSAIALASSGRIFIPEQQAAKMFPVQDVLAELVQFTGDPKNKDDVVDTLSYAVQMLPFVRPGFNSGMRRPPIKYVPKGAG